MKIFFKRLTLTALIILGVGFLIPQNLKMPVVGAGSHSYNHETFWYEGWGYRWWLQSSCSYGRY